MRKSGILLLFLFVFSLNFVYAFDFTEKPQFDFPTNELGDLDDVNILNPVEAQVILYNDSSNIWYNAYLNDSAHHVNASDYWITDEGALNNPSDIEHNWLSNLLWSAAEHIIDTFINMNENSIINISSLIFTNGEPITWNENYYTINVPTGLGNTIQVGQELTLIRRNGAGKDIFAGQLVYNSGSQGEIIIIDLADSSNGSKIHSIGMVTIPVCNDNAACPITYFGSIHDLNTSDYAEGTVLYLSSDGSGNITDIIPTGDNYSIHIGEVSRSHVSAGIINFQPEVDWGDNPLVDSFRIKNNLVVGGNITADNFLGGDGFFDKVGIGTNSPDTLLHINSGAAPTEQQFKITANDTGGFGVVMYAPDNINALFDAEWIGNTMLATDTSVARIRKGQDAFWIEGSTGNTVGNAATMTSHWYMNLVDGKVSMGGAPQGAKLNIAGIRASVGNLGSDLRMYTTQDAAPVFELLAFEHDSMHMTWDAYLDGSLWKSSDAGSNFRIAKNADKLQIFWDSGIAQGGNVIWNTATWWDIGGKLNNANEIRVFADNKGFIVGGGGDASVDYDGTNMIINPKVFGSGYLGILGNLIIPNDNVGIGTNNPQNPLDVSGAQVIGSSYAGVNTAPTDGLLVEGDVGIGTVSPHNKLNVIGSINQTSGNLTGDMIYGNLNGHDAGAVGIDAQLTYFNVTNISVSRNNGFIFNASGKGELTVQMDGVYRIQSGWSFSGQANTEYHIAVGINFIRNEECHGERVIGTGGDVGSAPTAPCTLDLNKDDTINLMIENVDNAADAVISDIGLNILRVGN